MCSWISSSMGTATGNDADREAPASTACTWERQRGQDAGKATGRGLPEG